MKTIKLPYNRFLEDKTKKRKLSKSLNSIDLFKLWLIQCGIKNGKVKYNLINRLKNKIIKEKLYPLNVQGEKFKQGNRSFKLDIIKNNQIIFKLSKDKYIKSELPKLKNNIKKELFKLQQLNKVKNSIRFDLKNIYINFEEFKDELIKLNENKYLGIDLSKGKTLSKNIWNIVKIEKEETKIAYKILVKLIHNEEVSDNEKIFLKKHSIDLVKTLPIITIQGIPFSIPLTILLIILSKKIGFDILPKDYRYLLEETEK